MDHDLSSQGEIRGKLRVNLECGSAQPSLFKGVSSDLIKDLAKNPLV